MAQVCCICILAAAACPSGRRTVSGQFCGMLPLRIYIFKVLCAYCGVWLYKRMVLFIFTLFVAKAEAAPAPRWRAPMQTPEQGA